MAKFQEYILTFVTMMHPKHKSYTLSEAKNKLAKYCAYQDRCHKEVRTKLEEMRMIPEAIDQIMYELIQERYLDEERFARSFVRGKFNSKSWGKKRIISELKHKDISQTLITIALQEIDNQEYYTRFNTLAQKRYKQIKHKKNNKYVARKKLADYLLYRGWPGDWVYEKTKELFP